jgi:hypothetical protein
MLIIDWSIICYYTPNKKIIIVFKKHTAWVNHNVPATMKSCCCWYIQTDVIYYNSIYLWSLQTLNQITIMIFFKLYKLQQKLSTTLYEVMLLLIHTASLDITDDNYIQLKITNNLGTLIVINCDQMEFGTKIN